MTADFIPYGRHTLDEEDLNAVRDVLTSDYLTQGPKVPEFEKAIAKQVGCKEVIAVNSATSALHITCLALGINEGDMVWTSPITFVASANCARYCGANVDFVDIDESTGLMCPIKLETKLIEAYKKNHLPKAIIPVHLAGTSCEMRKIKALADKYDIRVIEDASHAIGGSHEGHKVGNCVYSDATIFSFHPVKIITCGEGGVVCCNEKNLAEKLRLLRSHGITKEESRFEEQPAGPWSYEQQMLGYNYRMTDIQAALGLSQLKKLREIINTRNNIFNEYTILLKDLPVELLKIPSNCESALHLAVIRLKGKTKKEHLTIFEGLRKKNIGVQLHYSPVHLQPYYKKLGFAKGDFPEAENYGESAISIPIFPGLKKAEQVRVVEILKALL